MYHHEHVVATCIVLVLNQQVVFVSQLNNRFTVQQLFGITLNYDRDFLN